MTYRDWHVGMKVVCVRADCDWLGSSIEGTPAVGTIYTIRNICLHSKTKEVGLRLGEIVNAERPGSVPDDAGCTELAFRATCFRPVRTRETDISIFTAMLKGARQKERA